MNHQTPLISIIIPYYNCKDYIEETLQSIENQTYSNYEIILVNDGSDEANTTFIEKLLETKPNVKYIYQENKGVSFARNNGGFQAKGEYILFLDADDLLHKTHLQKTVDILQSNPNCKLVYTKAKFFEAQTGEWELPPYQNFQNLLNSNIIYVTALHRYSDFITLNGFDENLSTHEDWDYWIRLLKDGGEVICLDEILFSYRKRNNDNSLTNHLINNPLELQKDWQKIYIKHSDVYIEHDLSFFNLIHTYNKPKIQRFKFLKKLGIIKE